MCPLASTLASILLVSIFNITLAACPNKLPRKKYANRIAVEKKIIFEYLEIAVFLTLIINIRPAFFCYVN